MPCAPVQQRRSFEKMGNSCARRRSSDQIPLAAPVSRIPRIARVFKLVRKLIRLRRIWSWASAWQNLNTNRRERDLWYTIARLKHQATLKLAAHHSRRTFAHLERKRGFLRYKDANIERAFLFRMLDQLPPGHRARQVLLSRGL